jgi:hypothetical protein
MLEGEFIAAVEGEVVRLAGGEVAGGGWARGGFRHGEVWYVIMEVVRK